MTNIVLTAITVILSTNAVEVEEVGVGNVKFCTNIVSEFHAYEINGRQFYHVMPPVTNVSRMELRWVESPTERTERSAVKPKPRSLPMLTAPAATNTFLALGLMAPMSNCVTRLWDGRTYSDAGDTNSNDSLVAMAKTPPLVLSRVNWVIGLPITAAEAAILCLPELPQYVQAMTKKPK